ncbi:iron-binding protein [Rhodobacterales bacterium HKCCE3408]|nr:iron-binding protein [Rhodobacterales bacterium HKCCE3408]
MKPIETDDLTIHFNGRRCIHARRCVLGLPGVFLPDAGRDWIQPAGADTEALVRVIDACPSGALSYERKDGGAEEAAPEVNTVTLWENGPIAVHAPMTMPDGSNRMRAALCRCGQSKSKPYCDNSHLDMRFKATSEPASDPNAQTPETRGGPVSVEPQKNGPMKIAGPIEIVTPSGRRVAVKTEAWLCRCGSSANKPFCDGSHKKIGFEAD